MSKASDAIKARRKEFRANHYTDNDRALMQSGMGQADRRKTKFEAYKSQGAQNAGDFNFDQYGKGHISGQEIKSMQGQGFSQADIRSAVSASGAKVGQRAQKKMDKPNGPDKAYFEQAVKRHGFEGKGDDGNADILLSKYQKNTQGLDQEVAMQALDGGRDFGEADKKRYDELMAKRSGAKEKAQNFTSGDNNNVAGDGNATGVGNNANTQENIGNTSQTVTQDNDQTSTVTGNNNYVNQQQDNSVRNYGGDTRVFNYQSGSNGGNSALDTPASAATMGGFYAPDDSHGAIAGRIDRNQTINRDAQKKYSNTSYIAQGAISNANRNAYIDPAALDKRIADRANYSRSKATTMGANLFGDMGAFQMPDYQRPDPAKPVETPDFEEMYNKYTDF